MSASGFPSFLPRSDLLAQYRRMLRLAQRFPSIKRDTLIEDIRLEWRTQSRAVSPDAVARAIEVGLRGEATLRKYTDTVNTRQSTWTVTLDEDPLGAGGRGNSAGNSPGSEFVPFGDSPIRKLR